jgi:FKBP-type peptidyl-prolyl cis-trans isomerase
MAKKTTQRIFIWIIAVVMALGTLGLYLGIILANNNQSADSARQEADQQKLLEQYQAEQKKQAEERSKSLRPIEGFSVEPFSTPVNELSVTTVREGSGDAVVTGNSMITMNYTGWLPDGKIFDSTNENGKVTPYGGQDNNGTAANGFVPGFNQGIIGMKQGEVRKLIMPASEGYGEQGSGLIGPNTPIAFFVEIVKIHQ